MIQQNVYKMMDILAIILFVINQLRYPINNASTFHITYITYSYII